MRVILRQRRNGKTRTAVEAFLADPRSILVVAHVHEREHIITEYKVPAVRRQHIVTPRSVRVLRGTGQQRVIIDNADIILQMLLLAPVEIVMITATDSSLPLVRWEDEPK